MFGTRIDVDRKTNVIGFIQLLESAKLIKPAQRELIIEHALAAAESPISLDKLKVIVLIVMCGQWKELDCLFLVEDNSAPRMLH